VRVQLPSREHDQPVTTTQARRRRGTGHELRDVVVRVATHLLAEKGDVDGLTMRAVAAAAGVTPPSVYRHFPDKQTLVRTVIEKRFDEFANVLRAAAASAGDQPMARLAAITGAYVQWGMEQPGSLPGAFQRHQVGPAGLGLDSDTEQPGAPSFRLRPDE